MKRELLKSRITGILALLIIPMFLIQILPGIIYDCGMNILAASILSSFVTILFSIFFSWKMVKEPVKLNIPKPIVICFFVVITLLFILVDQVLFIWINSHISDPGMEARAASIGSMNLEKYWIFYLLYGVILAPISEECLFRITLYRYLKKSFSWITALIMSSVMFGLIHMTISHLITATLFGIILVLIMEHTDCIWITIVCHIAYNLGTLCVTGNEMASLADSTVMTFLVFLAFIFLIGICIAKQDARMKDETDK